MLSLSLPHSEEKDGSQNSFPGYVHSGFSDEMFPLYFWEKNMGFIGQIFGAIRDLNPHKGEPLQSLYPKILTPHCNTTPTSEFQMLETEYFREFQMLETESTFGTLKFMTPGTPTGRRATANSKLLKSSVHLLWNPQTSALRFIWGFPKTSGALFEASITRIIMFWGPCPPIYRNKHLGSLCPPKMAKPFSVHP